MNKTSEDERIPVRCKVSHKDYQENIKDNPPAFQKKHSHYYFTCLKINTRLDLDNKFNTSKTYKIVIKQQEMI